MDWESCVYTVGHTGPDLVWPHAPESKTTVWSKRKYSVYPSVLTDTASHQSDVGITDKWQISSEQNSRTVHGYTNHFVMAACNLRNAAAFDWISDSLFSTELFFFFSQVTARTTKTQRPCELPTRSLQPAASTTSRWRLSAKGEMGKSYNAEWYFRFVLLLVLVSYLQGSII